MTSLLLAAGLAHAACDASCEEWKHPMKALNDYDQVVLSGVQIDLAGGGVAAPG